MIKKIISLFLIVFMMGAVYGQTVLKKGMTIRSSMKIRKGNYTLNAPDSLNRSLLVIEGNNIVVDFAGSELKGSSDKQNPDEYYGVAIIIRNGKNITIRNLSAKGFKVALMARNVEGLVIEDCNFSYNYRQRLNSTQVKEDISDWMSYHHNENDEWLRYGAAMYLRGCTSFSVRNCTVTGGQNALMLMECNNGRIYNNNFSFNSGIGLGLYRSSHNQVLHNRINFNVRGYSHGVYSRGQDSAGILVYEQSNDNLFFKNSVTHGGDGFFLWAGQHTMDTGEGGCNDNQVLENDFSFAPTNGVEVTFSRNVIQRNRIYECDHGIWGGYSFESTIAGNQFRNNRIAIAIEHGQHNKIQYNIFFRDGEAIRLWSGARQPSDWGYAKYRDTRSVGYQITGNSFNQNPLVFNLTRTDSLAIFENLYSGVDKIFKTDSTVTAIDSVSQDMMDTTWVDYSLKDGKDPFKGNARLAGRKNIMMTEWGPYDFGYPLIWNTNPADTSGLMEFDVLGPKGKFKIITISGLEQLPGIFDSLPYHFSARKLPSDRTDIEIIASYMGPVFKDPFGNPGGGTKPYIFRYRLFQQPISFSVSWYSFDSLTNPIKSDYKARILTQRPFKTESTNSLDYAWWGGIKAGEQTYRQFLTIADGNAEFVPGDYELSVTWDDAVRVFVDGKPVLDEWNPSLYKFDEAPNKKVRLTLGGKHQIRVEHVELGGFATLAIKFRKL